MFHKIIIKNKLDMMSEIPKCPLSVFPSFLLSMKSCTGYFSLILQTFLPFSLNNRILFVILRLTIIMSSSTGMKPNFGWSQKWSWLRIQGFRIII